VPVEYFNPFRNVDIDAKISRDELARCAHFFGEVVGLGLRKMTECPLEVNLLPKSIRQRHALELKRPYLIGAAIALLFVPLCGWLYSNRSAMLKERQLAMVRAQVEQLQFLRDRVRREESRIGEILGKADQIAGLVQKRSLWTAMLQDINDRLLPNLWITSFEPQKPTGGVSAGTTGGGGRGRRGGAVPAPQPQEGVSSTPATQAITEIVITGRGIPSDDPGQDVKLVSTFAERLSESPYFQKGAVKVETVKTDPFTFTLRAKLANEIPL
jgi:hypothetical protein